MDIVSAILKEWPNAVVSRFQYDCGHRYVVYPFTDTTQRVSVSVDCGDDERAAYDILRQRVLALKERK